MSSYAGHSLVLNCSNPLHTLPLGLSTCAPLAAATGACPKSYGTNVAQLAGLPLSVVRRAAIVSAEHERHGHTRTLVAGPPSTEEAAANGSPAPMDVDAAEVGLDAAAVKVTQDVVAALRQRRQQEEQGQAQTSDEGAAAALQAAAKEAAARLVAGTSC